MPRFTNGLTFETFSKPRFSGLKVACVVKIKAPTILQFSIFCWNFAHVFYLPLSKKGCVGFFLFYLDLQLFAKLKKDLVFTHSFFTLLLITQDLNKIKKIPRLLVWRCNLFFRLLIFTGAFL